MGQRKEWQKEILHGYWKKNPLYIIYSIKTDGKRVGVMEGLLMEHLILIQIQEKLRLLTLEITMVRWYIRLSF